MSKSVAKDWPYLTMKRIYLLFFYALLLSAFAAVPAKASAEISQDWNGNVFINAHDSALVEILKELYDKYSIQISGLENRESDRITFSFEADTLEALLRGMLRYLGVKNYAIEFADATLTRVVVVPDSIGDSIPVENEPSEQRSQAGSVSVAQVQSIVEFSQAESLDLAAGDIIIEYDGVRITSAQQLVNEVEKKAENSQVEMVVIREKSPMRLILAGGIIGVRILTKKIAKEEITSIF